MDQLVDGRRPVTLSVLLLLPLALLLGLVFSRLLVPVLLLAVGQLNREGQLGAAGCRRWFDRGRCIDLVARLVGKRWSSWRRNETGSRQKRGYRRCRDRPANEHDTPQDDRN